MAKPLSRSFDSGAGLAELAAVRAASRMAIGAVVLFSAFVNLLTLTAPLYMLQVYDRVLPSGSTETLVALSLLAAFLFALMGVLDHARAGVMRRVGVRLQAALDDRVLLGALSRLAAAPQDTAALTSQQDLDALARFWASPALLALFDAPWTPLFIAVLFVFHPALGWLAVVGGLCLVGVSWLNQRSGAMPMQRATLAALAADRQGESMKAEGEVIQALGMSEAALIRWGQERRRARTLGLEAADKAGRWAVLGRTFRLFLQSATLGLAAWLVLREELTAGAMVAASILMGRALQPVEQAVSQWSTVTRAAQGKARLVDLLSRQPPVAPRLPLPKPRGRLEVQSLSIVPPGAAVAVLRGASFAISPGQALGVIGPSSSGKSSLARALVGVWQPASGRIRLDGAVMDHYGKETLGRCIGYLPQRVTLFDGTVAENIARLQPMDDPAAIIAAARAAGAHEMILALDDGYDTGVSAVNCRLSGGQLQRIGLARALYGDPALLVLDEPNASLDNDGAQALNEAVRAAKARGAAVVLMAHRPAALQECDLLMVLKDGAVTAFGPRDSILRDAVRNAGDIARSLGIGGGG